jgi:iron complex outermembrane recepter protein
MSHRKEKRGRRMARTAFVTAVSLDLLAIALPAHAQNAPEQAESGGDTLEEIVVRGVRGAQEAAIDIKRSSKEIVDSIVTEDIGKLPDVTITDALQRVTGIQISRAAGEGSLVSVRGAQQVLSTMNGERFVTAENLLDSTVSFQDIPASLVTGVNVYKSQHAALTDGGVGGLIDLQSIRALKLDEGFTVVGAGQAGWGSLVDGVDKKYEALLGYKWGDRLGMALSASFGDSTSASTFQQSEFDYVDEFATWIGGASDLNGDGGGTSNNPNGTGDAYIIPLGWNSFVNSREFDRERLGLAYNFNAQLSDSFEIIADVFYNEMDEGQHGQQLFLNGNFGGRGIFPAYTNSTSQPSILGQIGTNGLVTAQGGHPVDVVTDFTGFTNGLRGGVQTTLRETDALNTNLELRFGSGDKFSGSVRWVHADAERTQRMLTVAQQTDTAMVPRSPGGAPTNISPNSIPVLPIYEISGGLGSEQLSYVIGDQLAGLAEDPRSWRLHSNWLERELTESTMDVLRADGTLTLSENLSFEFGLRLSDRNIDQERADYFSPSGINGLLTKYQEVGYGIGQAGAIRGTAAGVNYDPLAVYTLDSAELAPYVTTVTDFGVDGLVTAFPFINTRALESPEAWRDALWGQGEYIAAPDRTYGVEEKQKSIYMKMNFDAPITDSVSMSGNIGVRVVRSDVTVFRNIVDSVNLQYDPRILAGTDPNHTAYEDLGDEFITTERTRALPSFNLNVDFKEDWRVKFAYYETQALQPLQNLGRGPITYYRGQDNNTTPPETWQRVSSIQNLGDPRLEPWLARSFSSNVEWYPRENSVAFFGVFYTDVDSYTYIQYGSDPTAADSDGIVRDGAETQDIQQGEGASYYGFELGYSATFDFLPGFLKNTGATFNYTFTPSQAGVNAATGEKIKLTNGDDAPLNNTAENQMNLVLFYQDAKFQARVAANYLSKQYQGSTSHWSFDDAGDVRLAQYDEATLYVDAGASYDINEAIQVYLQGQNLTEEAPVRYVEWAGNRTLWNQFERVISVGVRARF